MIDASAALISNEDGVRLEMQMVSTEIVLFYREVEDVEIEFDGLTVLLPSLILPQEVLEFIKSLGNNDKFSMEISAEAGQHVILYESGPNKNKIERLTCASTESSDATGNKIFVYKNGAVIIEELDSNDETHMLSSEQSIMQEGRVIFKNSGTTHVLGKEAEMHEYLRGFIERLDGAAGDLFFGFMSTREKDETLARQERKLKGYENAIKVKKEELEKERQRSQRLVEKLKYLEDLMVGSIYSNLLFSGLVGAIFALSATMLMLVFGVK